MLGYFYGYKFRRLFRSKLESSLPEDGKIRARFSHVHQFRTFLNKVVSVYCITLYKKELAIAWKTRRRVVHSVVL